MLSRNTMPKRLSQSCDANVAAIGVRRSYEIQHISAVPMPYAKASHVLQALYIIDSCRCFSISESRCCLYIHSGGLAEAVLVPLIQNQPHHMHYFVARMSSIPRVLTHPYVTHVHFTYRAYITVICWASDWHHPSSSQSVLPCLDQRICCR